MDREFASKRLRRPLAAVPLEPAAYHRTVALQIAARPVVGAGESATIKFVVFHTH
ncbi:hypothetical protein [Rosistilla oblonga]|uniref:hypothetical protein n=1 Tax=Rosistilla oblonga TaxID=2527990 RepID=UPI003A96CA76